MTEPTNTPTQNELTDPYEDVAILPKGVTATDAYGAVMARDTIAMLVAFNSLPAIKRRLSRAKSRSNKKLPSEMQDTRQFNYTVVELTEGTEGTAQPSNVSRVVRLIISLTNREFPLC